MDYNLNLIFNTRFSTFFLVSMKTALIIPSDFAYQLLRKFDFDSDFDSETETGNIDFGYIAD